MNETAFYTTIRVSLFKGVMSPSQFRGIDAILKAFTGLDLRWTAYVLATVFLETAGTMQPIEEYGHGKGYDYGKKLKRGYGPGKRVPYSSPDKIFFGRGYTQTTWYENYQGLRIAAKAQGLDWDFLNRPELLLQAEPAIWATKYAMINGAYTGKRLKDYFNSTTTDPLNARRIVNGMDKAATIAKYYQLFYTAFTQQ